MGNDAIGTAWERKHAHNFRPLTAIKEKFKTRTSPMLAGSMFLGILLYFIINNIQ